MPSSSQYATAINIGFFAAMYCYCSFCMPVCSMLSSAHVMCFCQREFINWQNVKKVFVRQQFVVQFQLFYDLNGNPLWMLVLSRAYLLHRLAFQSHYVFFVCCVYASKSFAPITSSTLFFSSSRGSINILPEYSDRKKAPHTKASASHSWQSIAEYVAPTFNE